MESHNRLGIYISKDSATAVCLGAQGKGGKVLGCFSVSIEGQEEANMQTLASLLAQGCAERKLRFSEVAVALDCAMFMQHSVHSEFSDPKRIAATVKFDTEEALATDIADVALAFEIVSTDETGSALTVFTAQRNVLSEVLDALQQYNLDPVTMEPDVGCLSRFVSRKAVSGESDEGETLFAVLSRRSGYLVAPSATASAVRTFLVGSAQDRSKLLAREVLVTTALVERAEPVSSLKVFDSAGDVDRRLLGEKVGIEASAVDLAEIAGIEPERLADCASPADLAIAYGAALSHSQKGHAVNFRDDFSPFQGKKLRLQRAAKFAAVSITILIITAGVFFQTQLYAANKDDHDLRRKFSKLYSDVTLTKLPDGLSIKSAVRRLNDLKRRIEREKKGLTTDGKSVSAKLTFVLTAFNKCAAKTDLNIKSITVATKTISITGDTSSRNNTQAFFKAIRDSGLTIPKESIVPKGGRSTFNIMVEPKN